jgi:hypothetical protein
MVALNGRFDRVFLKPVLKTRGHIGDSILVYMIKNLNFVSLSYLFI